jgi:CHASE2 domain-containing sensor protein
MKRPSIPVRLFGNPLSAIALLLAACYFIYEWWTGQGSPAAAFIAFFAAGYGMSASERLQKYYDWKREWEAMEGKRPGRNAARYFPALRAVTALAVWGFFAYIVITQGDQPEMRVGAALFWLATLVVFGAGVVTLIQRWRRRVRPRIMRDVPVTLCVPIPHRSPASTQAMAALPEYCRILFDNC